VQPFRELLANASSRPWANATYGALDVTDMTVYPTIRDKNVGCKRGEA